MRRPNRLVSALARVRSDGTNSIVSLPAPTGGINTREALADLKPTEARELDNWIVSETGVKRRPGRVLFSETDVQEAVATLHVHDATVTKWISASGEYIHDVSAPTAVKLGSGYTNDRWQTEYYSGYSFLVNGADAPIRYDGSTLGATGFSGSGLTLSDLINVRLVRDRLWFCEDGSADVWYGGAGAVTGTLTKFQLSQVTRGGYCMAIGSWSQDAGDGPDDYVVFIMSTGQVLVYQGDPASTFSLVGKYESPRPIGRRCIIQYGGEIVIITTAGLVSGAALLSGKAFDTRALETLGKIAPSFAEDAALYGSTDGWEGAHVGGLIYVNVPQGTASKQWVYNTQNGTWTTFSGLRMTCMAVHEDSLYFGWYGLDSIWQLTGTVDNPDDPTAIVCTARPAYVQPARGRVNVTGVRPVLIASTIVTGRFVVDTDYIESKFPTTSYNFGVAGSSTPWGSAWGSPWGARKRPSRSWRGAKGSGFRVSVAFEFSSSNGDLSWNATDIMVRAGNAL